MNWGRLHRFFTVFNFIRYFCLLELTVVWQRSQLVFRLLLVQISAHAHWLFRSKSVQGNTRLLHLLCHDHLLPNPFQFIRPFCHSMLYSVATCNRQNKIICFRFWENFVSQPCCSYFHLAYCIVKEGGAVAMEWQLHCVQPWSRELVYTVTNYCQLFVSIMQYFLNASPVNSFLLLGLMLMNRFLNLNLC